MYALAPTGRIALQRIEKKFIFHSNHDKLMRGHLRGRCTSTLKVIIEPKIKTEAPGTVKIKGPTVHHLSAVCPYPSGLIVLKMM